MYGFKTTVLLGIATRYAIAAELEGGPKSSAEIAQARGLKGIEPLHQTLLGLAAFGVLRHESDGRFSLTPLGALLLPDRPGSAYDETWLADMVLHKAYMGLPHAIETGESAFESVYGEPFFAYLGQHPDIAMRFAHFLGAAAAHTAQQIVQVYHFADETHPHPHLIDVGGGSGVLLIEIAKSVPAVTGTELDNAHVIPQAQASIRAAGLSERLNVQAGNFFQPLGVKGDILLLSQVLHNWNDEQCRVILGNCIAALNENGRILVVEARLPDQITEPGFAIDQSLNMATLMHGRERTEREFQALFASVGLTLSRTLPIPPFTIFEATPRSLA